MDVCRGDGFKNGVCIELQCVGHSNIACVGVMKPQIGSSAGCGEIPEGRFVIEGEITRDNIYDSVRSKGKGIRRVDCNGRCAAGFREPPDRVIAHDIDSAGSSRIDGYQRGAAASDVSPGHRGIGASRARRPIGVRGVPSVSAIHTEAR